MHIQVQRAFEQALCGGFKAMSSIPLCRASGTSSIDLIKTHATHTNGRSTPLTLTWVDTTEKDDIPSVAVYPCFGSATDGQAIEAADCTEKSLQCLLGQTTTPHLLCHKASRAGLGDTLLANADTVSPTARCDPSGFGCKRRDQTQLVNLHMTEQTVEKITLDCFFFVFRVWATEKLANTDELHEICRPIKRKSIHKSQRNRRCVHSPELRQ